MSPPTSPEEVQQDLCKAVLLSKHMDSPIVWDLLSAQFKIYQ